jgi:hypothetical protein
MNRTTLKTYLGAHDIFRRYEDNRKILRYTKIIEHPKYKGARSNFDYDMALYKLPYAVNFTEFVSPACMPTPDISLDIGKGVIITGWVFPS